MIYIEAKVGLQSNAMVQNANFPYLQAYYFSNNTASNMQTPEIIAQESRCKESKAKDQKSILARINAEECLEQRKKDEKKKTKDCKQDNTKK